MTEKNLFSNTPEGDSGAIPPARNLILLECNLDDMTPELLAHATDVLRSQGALDVWETPIVMKKNRSATQLSVLCAPETREQLLETLFLETTTFGVREQTVLRHQLTVDFVLLETPWGKIPIKRGSRKGKIYSATPEYEACRQAAERSNVPLRQVYGYCVNRCIERPLGTEQNPDGK